MFIACLFLFDAWTTMNATKNIFDKFQHMGVTAENSKDISVYNRKQNKLIIHKTEIEWN